MLPWTPEFFKSRTKGSAKRIHCTLYDCFRELVFASCIFILVFVITEPKTETVHLIFQHVVPIEKIAFKLRKSISIFVIVINMFAQRRLTLKII